MLHTEWIGNRHIALLSLLGSSEQSFLANWVRFTEKGYNLKTNKVIINSTTGQNHRYFFEPYLHVFGQLVALLYSSLPSQQSTMQHTLVWISTLSPELIQYTYTRNWRFEENSSSQKQIIWLPSKWAGKLLLHNPVFSFQFAELFQDRSEWRCRGKKMRYFDCSL